MLMSKIKLGFLLIILGIWTAEPSYAIKPFIIDTDVGVDDVIAILYLLQHPNIEVKAITIESDGNAHCNPARKNTLGLLRMIHNNAIPVACGQEKPLRGNHHFPEKVLEESDSLAGAAQLLPLPKQKTNDQLAAVDLIIKTIHESSQPINILAIGPLTNIAQALQKSPEIKKNIHSIYIMGGALEVPGNIPIVDPTSKNYSAEWNIYIDPLAAKIVLSQKIPIVLVPLDITDQLPIDMEFYNTIKKYHQSPVADFVFTLLKNNINMIIEHGWYFWDPLAAVIASDESIAHFVTQPIKIILSPEKFAGKTIIDPHNGFKMRIVTKINKNRFKMMLLNNLNKMRLNSI